MSSAPVGRVGVLVMAHGTPSRLEDVASFYTEIRRGRPPPPELLADLERRYRAIGGTSPLNEVTRAQADAVDRALQRRAPGRFVVRSGARFAAPRIEDALVALADTGVERVVGIVLAPHSSGASVAEYARRARTAGEGVERDRGVALAVSVVDHWYDAPGFDDFVGERVRHAVAGLPAGAQDDPAVIFTAHSVPAALGRRGDSYAEQVTASAGAAALAAGARRWSVAWQSAGRTDDEWLGPDVRDVIAGLPATGATGVVVCPIGFVADHLEVLYDIDVEARAVAEDVGLAFART
ncbi:MAG: ferrochelatase, partial [Acidimicrobiales bacterium]